MVDDINKKIDRAPQNPDKDFDNLLEKFRDHLGYLAKEVYETSKNAYDKALQSLQEWLSSQKKEVQKNTVDAL
jgi:F0F1-type ATP synthase membrane subunit b/b'